MDSDPRAHSNSSAFPRLPCPTEQRARAHQEDSDVARATRYQFSCVACGPPGPWGLSSDDARRFVVMVRELAEVIDDPPAPSEPITPDPDHDFLVLLAEAADVDVLVSGDSDLTGLHRTSLVVKTPGEFLASITVPHHW